MEYLLVFCEKCETLHELWIYEISVVVMGSAQWHSWHHRFNPRG